MSVVPTTVGWIGLGRMGCRMSAHVAKKFSVIGYDLDSLARESFVKNAKELRKRAQATPSTSSDSGTMGASLKGLKITPNSSTLDDRDIRTVDKLDSLFPAADVIFCSLPTSTEVRNVAEQFIETAKSFAKDKIFVDCSSGDWEATKQIETILSKKQVTLLDCPVSGGPQGAKDAILTSMISGNPKAVEIVRPMIAEFSKNITVVGNNSGDAHAVKAVNNLLNVTNLMGAMEGFLALQKAGVDMEAAFRMINNASGRSCQTEVRIPREVYTGNFDYGFYYSLMAKDCRQAHKIVNESKTDAVVLRQAAQLYEKVEKLQHPGADYTEICKHFEDICGVKVRAN